jgi:subtilisin family serine protease
MEVPVKSFLITTFSVAGLVLAAGAARADDVRVIVGFKGEPSTALVSQHGGQIHRASGRFVAASLPAKALAKLRADAAVAYVEEDGVAEAMGKVDGEAKGKPGGSTTPPPQTTPWGVTRVGAAAATATGAGVRVAVIDTGIDMDHPDLVSIAGGVDYVQDDGFPDDDNGHGSHVAGTIAARNNTIGAIGVAPGAALYAVKVLDRRGSGWLSDVAAGIDWVANKNSVQNFGKMHIANMSLGARTGDATLEAACAAAAAAGVLLVAAAGNSGDGNVGTEEWGYPAAYTSCVAVGATNIDDELASFSNTGPYVDVSAPGVSVYSTYKNAGYATLSGTSMASPHAAGVAARIWGSLANPTAATVRAKLEADVADLGDTGWDAGFGHGLVQWK